MDVVNDSQAQGFEPPKRTACNRCRKQKLRCPRDGLTIEPCLRCQRAKVSCVTSPMGRAGRPARSAPNHGPASQSHPFVHMDLATFDNIVDSSQAHDGQAVIWPGAIDSNADFPRLHEWTAPPPSQTDVGTTGTLQPLDCRQVLCEGIQVTVTHDGQLERIRPSGPGKHEGRLGALSSGTRASCMRRLMSLTEKLLSHSWNQTSDPGDYQEAGNNYAAEKPPTRRSQLDQVSEDCSELTDIIAEMDNMEYDMSLCRKSASTWASSTSMSSETAWSDPFPGNNPHDGFQGASGVADPALNSHRPSDAKQGYSDARDRPHPLTAQSFPDGQDSSEVDITFVLIATSCYIQIKRMLHRVLSRTHDALIAGDTYALSSLVCTAASQAMLGDIKVEKNSLQIKLSVQVALHVLECLEAQMGISAPLAGGGTSERMGQRDKGIMSRPSASAIVKVILAAEEASCFRRRRGDVDGAAGFLGRDDNLGTHCIIREQIENITDHLSLRQTF